MYKESRFVNGITRVINVLTIIVFILGELSFYVITKAQESSTYTDYRGYLRTYPAKQYDIAGFITYSIIWTVALVVIYIVIFYIINGFRSKNTPNDKI